MILVLDDRADPAPALASDLPITVLILDDHGDPTRGVHPLAAALTHPDRLLISSSLAHPEHLGPALEAALGADGPAMIRLDTPSPSRHGFATEETRLRAAEAVAGGIQPLFSYDPSRAGGFAERLELLDVEPDAGQLATWLADQGRFAPGDMDAVSIAGGHHG